MNDTNIFVGFHGRAACTTRVQGVLVSCHGVAMPEYQGSIPHTNVEKTIYISSGLDVCATVVASDAHNTSALSTNFGIRDH